MQSRSRRLINCKIKRTRYGKRAGSITGMFASCIQGTLRSGPNFMGTIERQESATHCLSNSSPPVTMELTTKTTVDHTSKNICAQVRRERTRLHGGFANAGVDKDCDRKPDISLSLSNCRQRNEGAPCNRYIQRAKGQTTVPALFPLIPAEICVRCSVADMHRTGSLRCAISNISP